MFLKHVSGHMALCILIKIVQLPEARKMLVRSGIRTLLVMPLYYNSRSYSVAHFRTIGVYATVIRVLIGKFVKAMLMNLYGISALSAL